MTTDQKLEHALQALRDVVDPVSKYRRELPTGYTLDGGGCANLLGCISTYTKIADDAFRELSDMVCEDRGWSVKWSRENWSAETKDEGGVVIGTGRTREDAFLDALRRTYPAYVDYV